MMFNFFNPIPSQSHYNSFFQPIQPIFQEIKSGFIEMKNAGCQNAGIFLGLVNPKSAVIPTLFLK